MKRSFARNLGWLFVGIFVLLSAGGRTLRAQVSVEIPKLSAKAGTTVRIPLNVGDLTGKDVTSFEFVVACDTTLLRFSGIDQEKTLSSGSMIFANNHVRPYGPGKMKVVCARSQPLTGSGTLVYITGIAQKQNGTSSLRVSNCILNTGTPSTTVTDGSLTVMLPKAGKYQRLDDSAMTKK